LAQLESVREILTSDGRTLTQGALAWIWAASSRSVPIPGFKTVDQVKENAGAIRFGPLNDEQMNQIDQILGRESVKLTTVSGKGIQPGLDLDDSATLLTLMEEADDSA
jgi:aryl-alcohol dehydrogenase-like predicted oxidoreductase